MVKDQQAQSAHYDHPPLPQSLSHSLTQPGSAASARIPQEGVEGLPSLSLSPQQTPEYPASARSSVAFVERPSMSRTPTGSFHPSRRPLSRVHSLAQIAREARAVHHDENDTRAFYGDHVEGSSTEQVHSVGWAESPTSHGDLFSIQHRGLIDSKSVPTSLCGSRGASRSVSHAPSRSSSYGRLQDAADADSAALEYLSHSLSHSSTRESSNLLLRTGSRIQTQYHGTDGIWHLGSESTRNSRRQSYYTDSNSGSEDDGPDDTVLHAGRYFRPEDDLETGSKTNLVAREFAAELDWESEAQASPLVRLMDWLLGVPCENSAAALNRESGLENQTEAVCPPKSLAESQAATAHHNRRVAREKSLFSDPGWLLAVGAVLRTIAKS